MCRRSQSGDQRCNSRIIAVASSSAAASQQTTKCETEILGTERIDERVDGGVAVTEPKEDYEGDGWCTVSAEDAENVDSKERSPAKHETADDDAYSLGGFLLAVQPP